MARRPTRILQAALRSLAAGHWPSWAGGRSGGHGVCPARILGGQQEPCGRMGIPASPSHVYNGNPDTSLPARPEE